MPKNADMPILLSAFLCYNSDVDFTEKERLTGSLHSLLIVDKKMIAVIPTYQPDEHFLRVVRELLDETEYFIIVVNDGSSKETLDIFNAAEALGERIKILHHDVNRGKGAAMKTAFRWIKEHGFHNEGIVTVDADGQHLTKDIKRVGEQLAKNKNSLILGSRGFVGEVPLRSRIGNGITRGVFALTTGVKVYDTQTGLRAFSTELLDTMLEIKGDRYEYEMNQLLVCAKKKIPICELTIDTVYEDKNPTSHFHVFRDSWRIYKMIFAFMASSFVSWLVDYVLLLILSRLFTSVSDSSGHLIVAGLALGPKLPALIIARIISSFINYILNRKVVFEANSRGSMVKYYILAVFVLAANYGLLALFTSVLSLDTWLAQIIAQIILYPINFVLQRKYVFKEKAMK